MQPDNLKTEFFGIGIQNGKTPENLGVLWRTAQNLGASLYSPLEIDMPVKLVIPKIQ